MAFYFVQHLNLDIPDLAPSRRQIIIVNKDEVDEAVRRAQAATEEELRSVAAR